MLATIIRNKNYSRSYAYGRQWVWTYSYSLDFPVSVKRRDGSYFTTPAGAFVDYGHGLSELRKMLHRHYPGIVIRQGWK